MQAIQQIEQVLKQKTGTWLMASKQIEQYCRRKIPSSSIPTYFYQYIQIKLQLKSIQSNFRSN
ncbi:unnamed protein product [Paramecium sonneborni]|uniref:Uncharacterized protein n=1 Tax=Paramecium sonneborni TaxID=65129 RepID=A0A8S1M4J7_9CILI|nr:unnamed protein product [Paramecium sonneborni]